MAGRDEEEEEEEEKSPVGCGRKWPLRWKDSEDSVLEMDDLLPVGEEREGKKRRGEDKVRTRRKCGRVGEEKQEAGPM